MRKHTYTNAEAPTNTGSLKRPGRFNMRLDCETRARTINVFIETRQLLGMPNNASFADVWEHGILKLAERAIWHIKESPAPMRNLVKSMYCNLEPEDYVRNRYAALKKRFEPQKDRQATFDFVTGPTAAAM